MVYYNCQINLKKESYMKIIFLDIDGVLNCDRYIYTHNCFGIGIDPSRTALVADIVKASGAKIVLTTSWRSHWSENPAECDAMGREINTAFAAQGISVYSKTPHLYYNREEEIKTWLEDNPNVTEFVVIDDMWLKDDELDEHFVRTSPFLGGICEDDALAAIEILKGRI
jgi:hypothetical protein